MRPDPANTPHDALRVMRTIGLALAGGVTTFAVVAWLTQARGATAPPDGPWLFYLWIAIATSLVAASMILWRGSVVPILEEPASEDWRPRAASIQSGLVTSWALVEAAALFGVLVYFMAGYAVAGGVAVAMIWAALALTWPREDWLATASRSP
jgi:hypothetical protein